jgi:hypothetical protein
LYFEGCPNHHEAVALVQRVVDELGAPATVRQVDVPDAEAAEQSQFLGSPSIRINGTDIEPGAEERTDFGHSCRVFQTAAGVRPYPERQWIVDALLRPAALQVLEAARIPPKRTGKLRVSRLSSSEQEVYREAMRALAQGRSFSKTDDAEAFDVLAREDLVHTDAEGNLTAAYPFSGRPTRHRVRIGEGDWTHAMCALDALGMSAMFNAAVEIESRDPITDEQITVHARPGKPTTWEPTSALVFAGAVQREGPAHYSCCDVLNFFASEKSARVYQSQHPELNGSIVEVPVAEVAGRIIFGDALPS